MTNNTSETAAHAGNTLTFAGVTLTWDMKADDKRVYVSYQVTTPGGDSKRYWGKIHTPTDAHMVCVALAHSIALTYTTGDTVVFTLGAPFPVPVEEAQDFLKNYVTQYCTFAELMEEKSWNR